MRSQLTALVRNLIEATTLVFRISPKWSCLSIAITVTASLLPLVVFYGTKQLVDLVVAAVHAQKAVAPSAWFWIAATAAAGWATFALRSLASYVTEAQGGEVSAHIQEQIAQKSASVDLAYYETPEYFDTLHRAQFEAATRPTRVVGALIATAQAVLSLGAILGLIVIVLRWDVLLLVAAVIGPGLWLRFHNVSAHYRWHKAQVKNERKLEYYNWLGSTASYAKEIRLFGLSGILRGRAGALRSALHRDRLRLARNRNLAEVATQGCAAGAVVVALAHMVHRAASGEMSVGGMVISLQAFQRAMSLVGELVGGISQLYEHGLFVGRLSQFLNLEEKIVEPANPVAFPNKLREGIVFEHVTFRYPSSGKLVLDDFSLKIRTGRMVALVGENGAGKSTLIKLLCRLYQPSSGRITIDGIDLREFARADLWRHISALFQDFGQFYSTVADSIWFGECDHPPDVEAIREAAKRAGAASFIHHFPAQYEQMLGTFFEGGTDLSGGQWQKIALSRAFYRDAPIIILDEPTSALDPKAEHDLFLRFKSLTKAKTSLVISHRLSTVRMADEIYCLENGKIIEVGSHEELLAAGGNYARLFETQAESYR